MAVNLLNPYLPAIRVPSSGQKVYKDECAYSFDTPESEDGLYICMQTFLGLGKKHVERHHRKTNSGVYLRLKRIRKEIPQPTDETAAVKPTKLAIGMEGGFNVDEKKYRLVETTSIVILPDWTEIPFPNEDLPAVVTASATAILAAEDAWKLEEAAAFAGTWDGEKRIISKHAASLQQLDNGVKIPPTGWKCEQCSLTNNLWLNLTDGSILCGRKFFDGSGGNNHAVEAYAKTKYPLAVKLGTITPDGADVFSYDEDDMVEDPNLAVHLSHWGINISAMQKTEKTMLEMEIDLNQKIGEWDVIQEAGSKLTPVFGPGLTGIRNLGNSCYMNSVMQILFTIPDFKTQYADAAERIFEAAPNDPTSDFRTQMAKFGHGLLSGDYSKAVPEGSEEKLQRGVRPQMFKSLVGRGHPEFSTKRQQDAQEFLLHMANLIERHSRGHVNPCDSFRFEVEERVQCGGSGKVRYTHRSDVILSLPIPLEAATNKDAVRAYEAKKQQFAAESKKIDPSEIVRPRIPLQSCIEAFAAVEVVDDFYSSAIQDKCKAQKSTRLSTFPDFIITHLKKFTIGEDWVPKKLDVCVEIPDTLDLSALRGEGMKPGEEELPAEQSQQPEIVIDESVVAQLTDMGFAFEGCRKAVYHTKNSGVEAAMNWVVEHMEDPDFAVPLQIPSKAASKQQFSVNEEAVAMIVSMGFTIEQATKALKATDNNMERACDWILSHAHELDQPMETEEAPSQEHRGQYRDGQGKYRLVGFISHMGTSSLVGHYVCHILKNGQWVIFNDEKVALSVNPPKELAYLYLYQRED